VSVDGRGQWFSLSPVKATIWQFGINVSEIGLGTCKWEGVGRALRRGQCDRVLQHAVAGHRLHHTPTSIRMGQRKAVGRFVRSCASAVRGQQCGRQFHQCGQAYTPQAMRTFVEPASRVCDWSASTDPAALPPMTVYYRPRFSRFSMHARRGQDQASRGERGEGRGGPQAIEFDNVRSVQIIYNMFDCARARSRRGRAARGRVIVRCRWPAAC